MRSYTLFALHAPRLMGLTIAALKFTMGDPGRAMRMAKRTAIKTTQADREALLAPAFRLITEGIADALADGNQGVCNEFRALGQPWGFRLEDITVRMDMWHGNEDKSCPITRARGMAQQLPYATLRELPGVGHGFVGGAALDDASSALRAAAAVA